MILVAFVLVLVATVTLIIGTFFDAGVAYIWISIAACVATFVVLGISYLARRRSAEEPATRPAPLAARESRTATPRPEPRSTTVGDSAGPAREDATSDQDTSVTIVPSHDRTEPMQPSSSEPADAEAPDDEGVPDAARATEAPAVGEAATDEPAAEPAPRRVAPRRVVRRAPLTAASTGAAAGAAEESPAAPQSRASDEGGTAAPESAPTEASEATEAPATPRAGAPVRRVVRRPAGEGGTTRKVVRRAEPGTRTVVRGSSTAGTAAGQRRVRRVVRRDEEGGVAPAAPGRAPSATSKPDPSPGPESSESGSPKAASGRTGTRGKRARAALSEIKGVGPAKQDALLKRFGSLENMAAASIEELTSVKGVGQNVANEIKRALADR